MLRLLVLSVVCAVAVAMTTTTVPSNCPVDPGVAAATILYDFKHHVAMIVRTDGCFEYHMNHQDVVDAENDATRGTLETRMLAELAASTNCHEMGHHHIDHMPQDIRLACANLKVYGFDRPHSGK